MADKMSIVGTDGKTKFVLDENNTITDLRKSCRCFFPEPKDRVSSAEYDEQPVCRICGRPIPKTPLGG